MKGLVVSKDGEKTRNSLRKVANNRRILKSMKYYLKKLRASQDERPSSL